VGWRAFWAPAREEHSTGVALLIRSSLIESGEVKVGPAPLLPDADGRFICLPISWGGHHITLANVYAPTREGAISQRAFIDTYLHGLVGTPPSPQFGTPRSWVGILILWQILQSTAAPLNLDMPMRVCRHICSKNATACATSTGPVTQEVGVTLTTMHTDQASWTAYTSLATLPIM
jgi:hypothetical protein